MHAKFSELFSSKPGNLSELIKQALPAAISQASFSLMMLTDRLLLTPLGKEAPSASMLGGFTSFLMIVFFTGLLGYITPLTGQMIGAKKEKGISSLVNQGMIITLLVSPFIILVGRPLAELYFDWAGIHQTQKLLALKYFTVVNCSCLFGLASTVLGSFFIGIGRTYIVMMVNTLGMLINIPMTYYFIHNGFFGYFDGVQGSALGSLLSGVFMVGMFCFIYLSPKMKELYQTNFKLKLDRKIFNKLIKFGAPSGFEITLTFAAFSTFMALFHSYGPKEALAATIVLNWEIAAFLPAWGVSVGVSSLVGKYMGARDIESALRSIGSGFLASFLVMFVACFLFVSQTETLVSLFIPRDPKEEFEQILKMSAPMLQLVCLYCLSNAFNLVLSGALRAAGDTKSVMVIAIMGQWLMLGSGYYCIKIAALNPITSWFIFCCSLVFESIFFAYRFNQGHWKKIKVI